MSRPTNWRRKALLGFVILALAAIFFVFSDWGYNYTRNGIEEAYAKDLRDNPGTLRENDLADRFLSLARWRAMLMDETRAIEMYKEFCGAECDISQVSTTGKLSGKCTADGKLGWGPMHPRAPEAFFNSIKLQDESTSASKQAVHRECFNYYRLFYTWMRNNAPDHHVHPNFNCYWPKIKRILARHPSEVPPDIDMNVPNAPKSCPDPEIETENASFQK